MQEEGSGVDAWDALEGEPCKTRAGLFLLKPLSMSSMLRMLHEESLERPSLPAVKPLSMSWMLWMLLKARMRMLLDPRVLAGGSSGRFSFQSLPGEIAALMTWSHRACE